MRLKPDPAILRALIYGKTTFVTQGFNLVTISIIIRALGNDQFGLYQYALGLIGVALIVGHVGTDAIAFREFSMPVRHACGALPRVLLIRLGGISASLAVMWLLVILGIFPVPPGLFGAVAATATVESFLRVGNGWHRARHKAWLDFWTSTARSVFVLALVIIIVPCHPNPFGIALAYGTGAIVILLSLLWQWRRILRVGWKIRYPWRHLLDAAPAFFFLDLTGNLIGVIPIFIMGYHHAFAEIGRYSVYSKYLAPFALAATLYVQSLQPSLVNAFHRGTPVRPLIRSGAGVVTGAGLLGSLCCLSIGAMLVYYLGHQQPLDIQLLCILAVFPLVFGWASLAGSVLGSARKERSFIMSRSMGFIACCLISIISWEKGAVAAAWAIIAAFSIESLSGALFAKSLCPKNAP